MKSAAQLPVLIWRTDPELRVTSMVGAEQVQPEQPPEWHLGKKLQTVRCAPGLFSTSRGGEVTDRVQRDSSGDPQRTGRKLSTGALATRSTPVLDLAPRRARVIGLAGAIGVMFVLVGSLSGNRPETVGVDKLLHAFGYGALAALFVLALPPSRYLAALGGLAKRT
jgi:hypothetical protein